MVERLAIVGLGLIGGSIAGAARARSAAREIVAVSRTPASIAQARRSGIADRATANLVEGIRDADLVVLCTPVGTLPGLVREAWPCLASGAVLTDVGSVKATVVATAESCPPRPGVAFVGSHPMAGSERSGLQASDPDLFEGRLVLLTPTSRTSTDAVTRLTAFWEALGSRVRLIAPEAHDRAVAAVSHLPQLAAYALVTVANGDALAFAGRGFGDTTRIAASAETLWADIFRGNREPLLAVLAQFRETLARWEALIREGQWEALEATLARAREVREELS